MKKYLVLTTLCVLVTTISNSQNFVPNSSFEDYIQLPKNICEFEGFVKDWKGPFGPGTPDYYHRLSSFNNSSVPSNFLGLQYPKSGNAYIGIVLKSVAPGWQAGEYIQTKLLSKLKKDSLYCIGMYISLAEQSYMVVDKIGIFLTSKKNFKKTIIELYDIPQIESPSGKFLSDSINWTLICGIYKAMGNESSIIIGNFVSFTNPTQVYERKKIGKNKYGLAVYNVNAYYYIDDVFVNPVSDESQCPCTEQQTTIIIDTAQSENVETVQYIPEKQLIFKNVLFETDKWDLLPVSYPELDKLIEYLKAHPEYNIEISGYTDNTGTDEKNLLLSENRAKSVALYLVMKGVAQSRMTWKGYGSSRPIAENNTEEGKAINRRVEYKIVFQ